MPVAFLGDIRFFRIWSLTRHSPLGEPLLLLALKNATIRIVGGFWQLVGGLDSTETNRLGLKCDKRNKLKYFFSTTIWVLKECNVLYILSLCIKCRNDKSMICKFHSDYLDFWRWPSLIQEMQKSFITKSKQPESGVKVSGSASLKSQASKIKLSAPSLFYFWILQTQSDGLDIIQSFPLDLKIDFQRRKTQKPK